MSDYPETQDPTALALKKLEERMTKAEDCLFRLGRSLSRLQKPHLTEDGPPDRPGPLFD